MDIQLGVVAGVEEFGALICISIDLHTLFNIGTLMTIGSTAACTPASSAVAAMRPRIVMLIRPKIRSKKRRECWQSLG